MPVLIALLLLAQADDVDTAMRDFKGRQERVRSAEEMRALAGETLARLDRLAAGKEAGRALFHAAEMCLLGDDVPAAAKRFTGALEKTLGPDQQATARYLLGELALHEGDWEGSRRHFESFLKSHVGDPRSLGARIQIESTHAIEGRTDAAMQGVRDATQGAAGGEAIAALNIASFQLFAGRTADGKKSLDAVVKTSSDLRIVESTKRQLELLEWTGRQATFTAKDHAGREIDSTTLRGRVTILYFYSITSPAASMEVSTMRRLSKALEGKALTVIGVCLDRAKEDFELLRIDQKIEWPVVHDANGTDGPLAQHFGVKGLPHVLILDGKGVARFVNPMLTAAGTEMRVLVDRLLAEK